MKRAAAADILGYLHPKFPKLIDIIGVEARERARERAREAGEGASEGQRGHRQEQCPIAPVCPQAASALSEGCLRDACEMRPTSVHTLQF